MVPLVEVLVVDAYVGDPPVELLVVDVDDWAIEN